MPGPADVRVHASMFFAPPATPASIRAAAMKVGQCVMTVCNAEGFGGAGARVLASYGNMEDTLCRLGHAFQYYGMALQGLPATRGNIQGEHALVVAQYEAIGAAVLGNVPAVHTRAGQAVAAAITYILCTHGEDSPMPQPQAARAAVDFLDMASGLGATGNMPAVEPCPFNDALVTEVEGKLERCIISCYGTDGAAERVRAHYPDAKAALTTLGCALRRGSVVTQTIVPDPLFDLHMALAVMQAAPEPQQRGGDVAATALIRALDAYRASDPGPDLAVVYQDLLVFLKACSPRRSRRPSPEGGN